MVGNTHHGDPVALASSVCIVSFFSLESLAMETVSSQCTTGFIALRVGSLGQHSTQFHLVRYIPLNTPLLQ